MDIQNIIIYLT